jgi:AcrR family transcriptional regulator
MFTYLVTKNSDPRIAMAPVSKPKKKQRLTGAERREAILAAALPLFAEVGFRGVTTKMLAHRAGVSEALLYQHFPSKESLHTEVQNYLCSNYPALEEKLRSWPTPAESLVYIIYIISKLLLDPPVISDVGQVVPRIMLQSILDDGSFVRQHVERNLNPLIKVAAAAIGAARKAGDITGSDEMPDEMRFLFAHHVIVMVHLAGLPATPLFDYPTNKATVIEYAVRFALRGIGMTDTTVAKYFDQSRLYLALVADLELGMNQPKGIETHA